jgi:hypothetical protein
MSNKIAITPAAGQAPLVLCLNAKDGVLIETASGKRSKRELNGAGEDEFASWVLGPTM